MSAMFFDSRFLNALYFIRDFKKEWDSCGMAHFSWARPLALTQITVKWGWPIVHHIQIFLLRNCDQDSIFL